MGRHHNRGWRAIPERNIVRLWNKFDGERFRGYVKVNEEHGEVIKAVVHYLEGRETWDNVEGELVDNLAMLIRLVVEGDGVIGFTPPESTKI